MNCICTAHDYCLHLEIARFFHGLGTPIRVQYLRRDYVMYIFFGVDSNAITVDDPSNECIIGDS